MKVSITIWDKHAIAYQGDNLTFDLDVVPRIGEIITIDGLAAIVFDLEHVLSHDTGTGTLKIEAQKIFRPESDEEIARQRAQLLARYGWAGGVEVTEAEW